MINPPWPTTDEQRAAQTQQRAETAMFEAARAAELTLAQQKMREDLAADQRHLYAMRAAETGHARMILAELEQLFPELKKTEQQTRDAQMQAQVDYDSAHAAAQRHAATPPESRDAIDQWVETGGALDRRVVGMAHLLKQANAAHERAAEALSAAVQQRVAEARRSAMRESNARRLALIAEVRKRQAEFEAWAKAEAMALDQFENDELAPLERVIAEGLVKGMGPVRRLESGMFDIE